MPTGQPAGPQGDALDTLTLDAPVADSPEAVVSPETPPSPPELAPPADQPTETPESVAPVVPGPDAVPAIPTPTFTAPTGDPFTLRVDRNGVPIEGAVVTPDKGVYFSPEAWRKVQSNFIGDRQSWQQERRTLLSQLEQGQQAKSDKELQADALLATLNELLDPKNRDDLLAKIEDWDREAPILKAQAEAKALIAERDRLAAEVRAREEADESARLIPEMQNWLAGEVEKAIGEYAGLFEPPQAVALVRELWEQHADKVFYEDPRTQKIHLDRDKLLSLVESRAEWIRQARAGMQKVEQKKANNAAVLTPTTPGVAVPKPVVPKVELPRDEQGRFQPGSRKDQKRAARDLLDDLKWEDVAS